MNSKLLFKHFTNRFQNSYLFKNWIISNVFLNNFFERFTKKFYQKMLNLKLHQWKVLESFCSNSYFFIIIWKFLPLHACLLFIFCYILMSSTYNRVWQHYELTLMTSKKMFYITSFNTVKNILLIRAVQNFISYLIITTCKLIYPFICLIAPIIYLSPQCLFLSFYCFCCLLKVLLDIENYYIENY